MMEKPTNIGQGQQQASATGSAAEQTRVKETPDRGAEMAEQTKQTWSDAYDRTSEAVSDAYDKTSRTLRQGYERAKDYSRENPGTTTLIILGAGVGIGLLLASGFSGRSRNRRFVAPVMNALTEIASELFR